MPMLAAARKEKSPRVEKPLDKRAERAYLGCIGQRRPGSLKAKRTGTAARQRAERSGPQAPRRASRLTLLGWEPTARRASWASGPAREMEGKLPVPSLRLDAGHVLFTEVDMDAQRVLSDMVSDLLQLEYDPGSEDLRGTCAANLEALAGWIRRGGFAPDARRIMAEALEHRG